MRRFLLASLILPLAVVSAPALAQVEGDSEFNDSNELHAEIIVSRNSDGTWNTPSGLWHAYEFLSLEGCAPDEALWRVWWMYEGEHVLGRVEGGDLIVEIPGASVRVVGAFDGSIQLTARGWVYTEQCGQPPVDLPDVQQVARSLVPETVVRFNPSARGLTGLDTWLWYDPGTTGWQEEDGHITATVSVDGYTVTAEAWLRGMTWDMGNDDAVSYTISGTELGPISPDAYAAAVSNEENPPRMYMYETLGDYTVTLTATWVGQWWFTDDTGELAGPFPLGDVDFSDSLLYNVIEVRSVLVD